MSYHQDRLAHQIECHGPDCLSLGPPTGTLARAVAAAVAEGWVQTRGRWECPTCAGASDDSWRCAIRAAATGSVPG